MLDGIGLLLRLTAQDLLRLVETQPIAIGFLLHLTQAILGFPMVHRMSIGLRLPVRLMGLCWSVRLTTVEFGPAWPLHL